MVTLRVWVLPYCLATEQKYATTNQSLLKMVWTYKGGADLEAENFRHKQALYNLVDQRWKKKRFV